MPQRSEICLTVTDSLFAQGSIPQNLVAISFEPSSAGGGIVNGELTFGGTDASKFIGSINFVYVPPHSFSYA